MQHKCKMTVLRKEVYPDLQAQYLADPQSGPCPFYEEGQEFWFERYGGQDDFWQMGRGTQCSEAWDAVSRYIYTALQGGSIMRGWTNDEKMMIACCSDGTRPVIFKIERIDYKALIIDGVGCDGCRRKIEAALRAVDGVEDVRFRDAFTEAWLGRDVPDEALKAAVEGCGAYAVTRID
ncbi:MAG: TIGR04076 family protein [Eubacteriales bacterium]|nr:TIGR04076 family protein [Eubacteriales bacterium]